MESTEKLIIANSDGVVSVVSLRICLSYEIPSWCSGQNLIFPGTNQNQIWTCFVGL